MKGTMLPINRAEQSEQLREEGLEALLEHLRIRDEDLKFFGSVTNLKNDPRVKNVNWLDYGRTSEFLVLLNGTRYSGKERIRVLDENGFPRPNKIESSRLEDNGLKATFYTRDHIYIIFLK